MQDTLLTIIALGAASLVLMEAFGCEGMATNDMTGMDGDTDSDIDGDTDTDSDTDGDYEPNDDHGAIDEPDTDGDCDTENEVVLYMSADDSNSMAGPPLARFLINSGRRVDEEVRTYEFLNYYDFNYEAAQQGTVNVFADLTPAQQEGEYDLQIGIRAPYQSNDDRRPLNITLSIDTSGSMDGIPIQRVKQCCVALAGSLREGDVVSMVTWSETQETVLGSHHVSGPNDQDLISHCNALSTGGATNLHSGLLAAYQLASVNLDSNRINRVILMSDGGANVGLTDANLIASYADDAESAAIYLMGVGVGDSNNPAFYSDELMNAVTDAGKGSYVFIDSAAEASSMFSERFLSNVEVAARDVRLELTLPPTFEMISFHGEEYSTNQNDVEPQHLAPNDAMIYHQTVGSCDPASLDMDHDVQIVAEFQDPLTHSPMSASFTSSIGDLLDGDATHLIKGNAIVKYAETLRALKGTYGEDGLLILDQAIAEITAADEALEGDPDLAEITNLLTLYKDQF